MNIKVLLAVSLILVVTATMGHSGKTATDGCHYCRTNCLQRGVLEGVRHCHDASVKKAGVEQKIAGHAEIIDGDSIRIATQSIRLLGIDAPELKQHCEVNNSVEPCGQHAHKKLSELIGGHLVYCLWSETDRYGRLLGTCYIREKNINAEMVKLGMALAYRRYSDQYIEEEQQARDAAIGLWGGSFIEPWKWRKEKRSK